MSVGEKEAQLVYEEAAKSLLRRALRTLLKFLIKLAKVFGKILISLLSTFAPVLVPVFAVLLIFGFLYFAIFMVPRYIMTGGSAPLEGQACGVMHVLATAYTAGEESTDKITATGTKAAHGTIAVDPDVIPFGTKIYVPGYGYGVAADTGKAIKGKRIDLFFDTVEEAEEWGRKWVTIKLYGATDEDISPSKTNVAILSYGDTDIGWTLLQDKKLYNRYLNLEAAWLDEFESKGELKEDTVDYASGNAADEDALVGDVWSAYMNKIPAEMDMAYPHRISWALLGGMDKVLGDPTTHGEHGWEQEGKGRKPAPEKHFAELRPKLSWQNFELYYYKRWTVKNSDGTTTTKEKKYKEKIRLLTSADCYDALYTYTWTEDVIEEHDEDYYKKVIIPKAVSVTRTGPYYARLRSVLETYGLSSDMDMEMILQIARNLDDTFALDSWLFSTPSELFGTQETAEGEGMLFDIWPVRGNITSDFGMRIHPLLNEVRFHTGIDIAAPESTPVVAVDDGQVILSGTQGAYGKAVLIEHETSRTFYAHLSSIAVSPGMKVRKGQVLGRVGSTGWSTGPHLHFEVRTGLNRTQYIDPMLALP